MTSYLLIESGSDREAPDAAGLRELAAGLSRRGHDVVLFLLQNAVLTGPAGPPIDDLLRSGVQVWVDELSVAARAPGAERGPDGVRLAGMPDLVQRLMTPGVRPVWH
jgi:hypothetical protein